MTQKVVAPPFYLLFRVTLPNSGWMMLTVKINWNVIELPDLFNKTVLPSVPKHDVMLLMWVINIWLYHFLFEIQTTVQMWEENK